MEKGTENKKHQVTLYARDKAEIGGVTEVESFDEQSVVLTTVCGEMTVEGESLHVSPLDITRGAVVVDGHICGIYYSDAAPAKRGFKRLFG